MKLDPLGTDPQSGQNDPLAFARILSCKNLILLQHHPQLLDMPTQPDPAPWCAQGMHTFDVCTSLLHLIIVPLSPLFAGNEIGDVLGAQHPLPRAM